MAKRATQADTLADFTEPNESDFDRPSPEEGARLVRAFLGIKNSAVRDEIVALVEKLSKAFQLSYSQTSIQP